MTFFIQRCGKFLLFFEIVVFILIYCFGPKGIGTIYHLQSELRQIQADIDNLYQDIKILSRDIALHQTSFAKEKLAREKLLMKHDHETVYFKTK